MFTVSFFDFDQMNNIEWLQNHQQSTKLEKNTVIKGHKTTQ